MRLVHNFCITYYNNKMQTAATYCYGLGISPGIYMLGT
jgi:hypothetical protein